MTPGDVTMDIYLQGMISFHDTNASWDTYATAISEASLWIKFSHNPFVEEISKAKDNVSTIDIWILSCIQQAIELLNWMNI